jgi:uncharacterized membrane protein
LAHTALLVATAFLASGVEMVEALTIILAVGLMRGWRTALTGAVSATVALTVLVVLVGPSLVDYVPLRGLQVVVGTLLLIFGLQWLRKAILRAAGLKATHDETAIFEREVGELSTAGVIHRGGVDWNGFVISFKGVFLEGLEVVFIVLTFGANAGRFGPSVAGAAAAVLLVTGVGLIVHKPLSQVPENAIKFTVGVALTTFGTFWGGEGIGIDWRLEDGMLLVLVAIYAAVAFALVTWLKSRSTHRIAGEAQWRMS